MVNAAGVIKESRDGGKKRSPLSRHQNKLQENIINIKERGSAPTSALPCNCPIS